MSKIVWVFVSADCVIRMGGMKPPRYKFEEYPMHWVEIRV